MSIEDMEEVEIHVERHLRNAGWCLHALQQVRQDYLDAGGDPNADALSPEMISAIAHEAMAHAALAMGMLTFAQWTEAHDE